MLDIQLNTIVCEDNVRVMKTLPDTCVDLTCTSPPYDAMRRYSGEIAISNMWDFESVAQQLWRVTKDGGVVVWVVADATKNGSETGTSFRQVIYFQSLGFNIHDTMIYKTHKPPSSAKRYHNTWEFMFVFSKGSPKTWNPIMERCLWAGVGTSPSQRTENGGLIRTKTTRRVIKDKKPRSNIWHYDTGSGKGTSQHPASFPLQLAKDHIVSWSNPEDLVLDPFAGSGTTLVATKELGRHFIGVEIHAKYVDICNARIAQTIMDVHRDDDALQLPNQKELF